METSIPVIKDFLIKLDKEAKENQQKKKDYDKMKKEKEQQENKQKAQTDKGEPDPVQDKDAVNTHYFTMMKQLTLWGYFTSKEGIMQGRRYIPVPGKYEGCVDYKKGDKSMAGLGG